MRITDKITAHNIDCMEFMRSVPDKFYDLAIVDPPYGINVNMNAGRKKGEQKRYADKTWDNATPEKEYFEHLFRVSKNQIIWGGNYFTQYLTPTKSWLFWDKDTPSGMSFSDGELAWTSFDEVLRKVFLPYSGFRGIDNARIHPTQKPVVLYKWLLDKYAKPGDRILDTHGGSMSIAIAAHDYGFELDICELDKDYFEKATERVKNHTNQMQLAL